MLRFLSFFIFSLVSFPAFTQTDTLVYAIVSGGNTKGFDKYWRNADGSYGNWFQYNDRGRGDSLRTVFREDEEGFPVYMKAGGVDYMKNSVSEEFSFANGKARWKNSAEEVETVVSNKAFYMGLNASGGHLLKALKANNNRLALLPFGEVEIRVLDKHTIKQNNKTKTLLLMEMKGFGYTPNYNWVDEQGLDFATVNEWRSTILQGYENTVDELLEVQKKHEALFYTNLAATLPSAMPKRVCIRNVAVFDSKNATLLPNRDVWIENGIIHAITEPNKIVQGGVHIIEGKGKTLVPGLWDMHTHMSNDLDGIFQVAAGVTHVRDMGNSEALLERAKRFADNKIIGPRVEVMSGFIDAVDPMAAPTGILINNVEEGLTAIRQFAAKGYKQIKLYSSIKPEWVKPLAAEAHRLGLRVCGHIPAFMTAAKAIENGYDEITHLNMLALNFFGDTIDTRNPLRFSVPAQRTASLDLQGREVQDFIGLLKTKNIAVDPTLMVFEDLFTARDKVVAPKFRPIAGRFPATMQRYIKAGGGGLPVPDGMNETYVKSFAAFKQITRLLYENGIRILPGTDDIAGFGLHRELELYVEAGIPAEKVLQIATWGPAGYTGLSGGFGQIAVGKKADLVMVEGNPVENISNIRNTRLVMANGLLYDPAKLYSAVSIKPQ